MTQSNPIKKGTGALNTLSQTLTEEEWENALNAAKAQHTVEMPSQDRRNPSHIRHQTVRRCLLRVNRGDVTPGLYVVRTRDISDGGLRLIHGGPIKPDAICCVIIETDGGQTLAAGGNIAWCNPISDTNPPAYEMGISFCQPIDASIFSNQSASSEDVA